MCRYGTIILRKAGGTTYRESTLIHALLDEATGVPERTYRVTEAPRTSPKYAQAKRRNC